MLLNSCCCACFLVQGCRHVSVLQGSLTCQQQQQQHSSGPTTLLQAVQQGSSPTTCSDLSHELLVRVLRYVELPLRLGCCGLVCRAWRRAAADATSAVEVHPQLPSSAATTRAGTQAAAARRAQANDHSIQRLQRCSEWLAKQQTAVTHLSLRHYCWERAHLHLPWDQLQQLQSLSCCSVWLQQPPPGSCSGRVRMRLQQHNQQQLTAHKHSGAAADDASSSNSSSNSSSSSSRCVPTLQASLTSLTNLTALQLHHVDYCCSGGLTAVSALSELQQLDLYHATVYAPMVRRECGSGHGAHCLCSSS
jgi:hypothetical protein